MRVIEKVKKDFWEDVAARSSHATFFHTPHWSDIISKTFGHTDITSGFMFDDGTRAVFPLMCRNPKFTMGLLHDYVSGPPYVYGGPIAEKELTSQQLAEILAYIRSRCTAYSSILIRGNPYARQLTLQGFKEVKDHSHVTELFKHKDEKDLFTTYSGRSREHIKSAIKSDIQIREVSGVNAYEELYAIYVSMFKYWGDTVLTSYPMALFKNFYYQKNQNIKLWAAYYNDKMIGGEMALYWSDKCTPYFSYHNREYSKLNARRLLLHTQFLYCLTNGYKYFDFMLSGQIKGLENFKKSMGAQVYTHTAWLKENRFFTTLKRIYTVIQHPGKQYYGS